MSIAQKVHAACIRKKKTLALAESCTGGLIASRLTSIPDASLFFLGSIVAYSPKWKEQFLGVSSETLKRFGAESVETVIEMADGLFDQTDTDYAIAISGFAGPSGRSPGKVFIAIGERGKAIETLEIQIDGTRNEVIEAAADEALLALLNWIEKK